VADQIGDGKLSFASPERLMTHLGLTPGSVSPFGLINDPTPTVRVARPRPKAASRLSFHPNINTGRSRSPPPTSRVFSRGGLTCGPPPAISTVDRNPQSAIRNPQSAVE
jgi:hypothetical protein